MCQLKLLLEVEELRQRLQEAEDALRAICAGRPGTPAPKDAADSRPSLPYLAAIADASDGAIRSWNPGAERLLGYSAGEIADQPVSLLWPPDRRDQASGFLERIARGEAIRSRLFSQGG